MSTFVILTGLLGIFVFVRYYSRFFQENVLRFRYGFSPKDSCSRRLGHNLYKGGQICKCWMPVEGIISLGELGEINSSFIGEAWVS